MLLARSPCSRQKTIEASGRFRLTRFCTGQKLMDRRHVHSSALSMSAAGGPRPEIRALQHSNLRGRRASLSSKPRDVGLQLRPSVRALSTTGPSYWQQASRVTAYHKVLTHAIRRMRVACQHLAYLLRLRIMEGLARTSAATIGRRDSRTAAS